MLRGPLLGVYDPARGMGQEVLNRHPLPRFVALRAQAAPLLPRIGMTTTTKRTISLARWERDDLELVRAPHEGHGTMISLKMTRRTSNLMRRTVIAHPAPANPLHNGPKSHRANVPGTMTKMTSFNSQQRVNCLMKIAASTIM